MGIEMMKFWFWAGLRPEIKANFFLRETRFRSSDTVND